LSSTRSFLRKYLSKEKTPNIYLSHYTCRNVTKTYNFSGMFEISRDHHHVCCCVFLIKFSCLIFMNLRYTVWYNVIDYDLISWLNWNGRWPIKLSSSIIPIIIGESGKLLSRVSMEIQADSRCWLVNSTIVQKQLQQYSVSEL
jgi:hypothetical protein